MNKRYMDFVPKNKQLATEKVAAEKLVAKKPVEKVREPEPESDIRIEEYFAVAKPRRKEPEFGVIEEYRPTFVGTKVEKRPLGSAKPAVSAAEIKAKKIVGKAAEKPAEAPKKVAEEPAKKDVLKVPKNRFVNTDKIEKRPLSKNVYKKKIETPKEKPSGPVTIISKPEGGSHIGMIVTIILTIVLGAAAGTVAFLLLPK